MPADATTPPNPAQQFGTMLGRLLASRQWDRALDVSRQWLSLDPENPDPHLAAAQALINLAKYSDAETHILKVLAVRPNNSFALRLASIACQHQDKSQKADDYIQRAIELQPNDAMNWYQLALMRYRKGLLDVAEKHARRSLELQPDNADTVNLIANCQRGNPNAQLAQYLRALELNPENAIVHNNIGAYYLNTTRDYAAAEASFRRSLQLDPTTAIAQKNLFVAIRHRDLLYRILTWPPTILRRASWSRSGHAAITRIALLLLWLAIGRYMILVFGIWLVLVWPLVRAYEYLTLSDILARAGVAGARRGGLLDSHRWPLAARLAIFALVVLAFWGGIYWLYKTGVINMTYLISIVVLVLVAYYIMLIYRWSARGLARASARRAENKSRRRAKQPQPDPY